jgi:hypothetical protein
LFCFRRLQRIPRANPSKDELVAQEQRDQTNREKRLQAIQDKQQQKSASQPSVAPTTTTAMTTTTGGGGAAVEAAAMRAAALQREKEQREKEQRDKEQREKEQREKEQREKEQREKELQQQQQSSVAKSKEKKGTVSDKQRQEKSRIGRASVVLDRQQRPRVVALYDYDAPVDGELSFKGGDTILVNIKDESGWWQGQIGDAIGWFPGTDNRLSSDPVLISNAE